jgi:acyl CoA:acetate/3-ketoacid CoA transferase beta subunit
MIISDLCVFTLERGKSGLNLIELAPGVTLEEVAKKTEAKFTSAL